LGLLVSAATSLVFEPALALHVILGSVFVVLVGCHLAQRRRVSARLASRLLKVRDYLHPSGRLALSDTLLLVVTTVMLVSGFWDYWGPHRTNFRWHAHSGVLLAIYLVMHTLDRRRRLRLSQIR
jgi:hypothetical protein